MVKPTSEFINQLTPEERYEMQRTLDILSGKERPFPCKNLEPNTIYICNKKPPSSPTER
jgi:hypothetical protein